MGLSRTDPARPNSQHYSCLAADNRYDYELLARRRQRDGESAAPQQHESIAAAPSAALFSMFFYNQQSTYS
jgi:hypothetical protein